MGSGLAGVGGWGCCGGGIGQPRNAGRHGRIQRENRRTDADAPLYIMVVIGHLVVLSQVQIVVRRRVIGVIGGYWIGQQIHN